MRKPRSAEQRLDDAVTQYAALCVTNGESAMWRAYRRALRALLKERADAACDAYCIGVGERGYSGTFNAIRAAVLRGRT